MYKLSFKFSVLGFIALIIFGAAVALGPTRPELAGGNSFHYSILFVVVIGVALLASMVFYAKGSLVHKFRACMAIIAFSTLYGFIGNLFYNFWTWIPGGFVQFSWAQLGIMELGGLVVSLLLFKLEPDERLVSSGLDRLHKGSKHDSSTAAAAAGTVEAQTPQFQAAESAEDFMKSKGGLRGINTPKPEVSSKTDMQPVVPPQEAVVAKKPAPTSVESAQAIMTPAVEIDLDASDEMLSGPLNPSPSTPAAKTPPPPAAAAASNATGNRLQAQKRRNTSTFTKLQALSASGTGSLKPTPVQQDAGSGDLRSLLDRLDSEPDDTDYESLPTPDEIRVAILFSEETVAKGDSKPKGFVGQKPQPLGQKPSGAKDSKPAVPVTPARPTPATAGGAGPSGQKPGGDGKPSGGLAGKLQQNKPTPTPGGTPDLASLLDRAEASSSDSDESTPEPVVSKEPKTPAEEVAPAADAGGLLSKRLMELSSEDEEELEAPAGEESPEPQGDEKVFAEDVDGEIDDIFSSLAPAEAQREVPAEDEPTEEEKAVPAEEETPSPEESRMPEPEAFEAKADVEPEPESKSEPEEREVAEAEVEPEGLVFNEGVDSDIDDVFSNLAPAESQRTIEDYKPQSSEQETAAEAEPETPTAEEEAEPAEEEAGLVFAQGVDDDLDDAFSNLAPAEAQLNVGDIKLTPKAEDEPQAEEEDGLVFAKGVDEDLDDVFSNLAPAEAQMNVGDIKLKKQEAAEPAESKEDLEATGDFTPKAEVQEEEEAPADDDSPLLKLEDSDVDDIFAGLAGEQLDVNAETLAKAKNKEEEPEVAIPASLVETGDRIPVISAEAAQKSAKQTGDMPAMSKEQAAKIKEDIKKAADGDEEDEDEESAEEQVPESPEAAKLKKELKEFGKLSGRSAVAPKPSGDSVGTMKTIGKLLIDNQAIENIIKAGEQRKLGQNLATARIISQARGQGIMDLLHKIDKYEGVVGSIIVGHDGLVMASTLKDGWDKDIMGALSTALLSTSNLTTKKLEIGKLRQMIMLTKLGAQEKTTVLTDVDVGILAVFVEETDITKLDGMLETIHKTIHG